jgi:dihydrofolate reductase
MAKLMAPADLLLGRKTFDIFEDYWPKHAEMWPVSWTSLSMPSARPGTSQTGKIRNF